MKGDGKGDPRILVNSAMLFTATVAFSVLMSVSLWFAIPAGILAFLTLGGIDIYLRGV